MAEDTKKPDAVLVPAEWKNKPLPGTPGRGGLNRTNALVMHAEQVLGTDYPGGQRAYGRLDGAAGSHQGSHYFFTHNPHDTLYFPSSHPRSGQSRYRWEQQADGSIHGFFVDDEARKTTEGKK